MPFTDEESREKFPAFIPWRNNLARVTDLGGAPGDRCMICYREMIRAWRKEPRWTTAHTIYKALKANLAKMDNEDDRVAASLAWQVFFNLHVMPYEVAKREENGEVE